MEGIDTHILLLLAGLPIVALILMLVLRLHALPSVLIAILLALGLTPWFPIEAAAVDEVAASLTGVAIAVAFIMFGGIIMSELLSVSGAQERISDWLNRAAHSPDRAMLLLGLGIAPLAESVIGFGVGVIITVPLLMRLGLSATKSVSISLLGILFGPWGSLGPGLLITTGMSSLSITEIGVWIALFNLPAQLIMGAVMAVVGLGARGALRISGELLVTTVVMWLALVAVNLWVNPALAGVIASIAGITTLILIARLRGNLVPPLDRATRQAFLPYGVVITSLLLATVVTSLWDLGEAEVILTSPALWIMATAFATPFLLRIPASSVGYCLRRGTRAWFVVCAITVLFIAFGGLLTANGMSETLATGAAQLGSGFLLILPAASFIGGYVTASNSGTAAMITQGITQTAAALEVSPAAMLGAQNAITGAAIMLSPSRFMLALGVARAQSVDASTLGRSAGERSIASPSLAEAMRPLLIAGALIVLVYSVLAPLVIAAA